MSFISVFDVLGPNMVGPSSSHTAGAAVIAALAGKLIAPRLWRSRNHRPADVCVSVRACTPIHTAACRGFPAIIGSKIPPCE